MSYSWFVREDYKSDHWLHCRHWDGYDKPDYFRILLLRDQERKLNSGRFRNHSGWVNDVRANIHIVLDKPQQQFQEVINWISDNIDNKWLMGVDSVNSDGILIAFWFEPHDLLAFKISFSNLCCV